MIAPHDRSTTVPLRVILGRPQPTVNSHERARTVAARAFDAMCIVGVLAAAFALWSVFQGPTTSTDLWLGPSGQSPSTLIDGTGGQGRDSDGHIERPAVLEPPFTSQTDPATLTITP